MYIYNYNEYSGEEGPKRQNLHPKSNTFSAQNINIHISIIIWKVYKKKGR